MSQCVVPAAARCTELWTPRQPCAAPSGTCMGGIGTQRPCTCSKRTLAPGETGTRARYGSAPFLPGLLPFCGACHTPQDVAASVRSGCAVSLRSTCVALPHPHDGYPFAHLQPDPALLYAPITPCRKVHLFDIDIPGQITFKESLTLSPGQGLTVVDTAAGRLGIGICYDIRFPEMAQIYAARGCQAIIYPGE